MNDKKKTTPGSMDLRPIPDWVMYEVRNGAKKKGVVGSGVAVQVRWALADWATEQQAKRCKK